MRGWFYLPDDADSHVPTIVMAHGFSAVKEQYLDDFAQAFASSGLGALVFDNRNFGASDGEPRQEIDPIQQIRDYRHAITFARTLSEVDRDRIAVWGTSFSGGHVLVVGAIDRRVRCVVSQVPTISGSSAALRRMTWFRIFWPRLTPTAMRALRGRRQRQSLWSPRTIRHLARYQGKRLGTFSPKVWRVRRLIETRLHCAPERWHGNMSRAYTRPELAQHRCS